MALFIQQLGKRVEIVEVCVVTTQAYLVSECGEIGHRTFWADLYCSDSEIMAWQFCVYVIK